MKSILIFLIRIVSCRMSDQSSAMIKSLTPQMHQLSTKMAKSLSPIHTKKISEYIFASFAKPTMISFTRKMSLAIPDLGKMTTGEKMKYAQDCSLKLGAQYEEHLKKSLGRWINSLKAKHQNHHSLQKRQSEEQVKPRKRLNTWGLFENNNRGNYLSNLIFGLITMPLWLSAVTAEWGSMLVYMTWYQVIISPIWNRISYGTWL